MLVRQFRRRTVRLPAFPGATLMNVDTVRKVDFYAGVPLCFLGTLVKKLFGLVAPKEKPGRPRKVLLIELSEMGSTVLADPAMRKLQRTLDAELYFAIFKRNRPSLDLLGTVTPERTFTIRDTNILALAADTIRFFLWSRKNRIDTVIDLELFARFTALLTGFSGATRTVGFHAFANEGLYRGDFLTHKVAYNPHLHISKNFISLVNALLSERAELPYSKTLVPDSELTIPKVRVGDAAREAMYARVREACPTYDRQRHAIVLFNTNASDLVPLRRWPQDHFIALARMVLDRYPRVVILLTGDPSERPGKEPIVRALGSERCVNFAGRTALHELTALYSISACMLTNDSGPAHFASVTDMPGFVLFGPETPKLYAPLGSMTPIFAGLACSPCITASNHRKTLCKDNVCMQVITPEQVFETLRPRLDSLSAQ